MLKLLADALKVHNLRFAARRGTGQLFFLVFLVVFVPRVTLGLLHFRGVDDVELDLIAKSIAGGHGFANAFRPTIQTGPTALNSPAYVYFKAGIFALFQDNISRGRAMVTVSSLFIALLCVSWLWLSERVGLQSSTGLLAAFLSAFLPVYGWVEMQGTYEVVLTALLAVVLVGTVTGHWRKKAFGFRSAWKVGVLAGGALLISSSACAIVAGLLLAFGLLSWGGGHFRAYARYAAMLIAVMLTMQLPWALRNYVVLGRPIFLRDGLGLELWLSNNPVAVPNQLENRAGYRYANHPFVTKDGLMELQRTGELRFFDACERNAFLWIRQNPKTFLHLTAARVRLFWFPIMTWKWQTALRWLVTLGGFFGLAILARRRHPMALVIGCMWLLYPPVYYLVSAQARYSYPVFQFQVLLCACAITHLAESRLSAPRRGGKPLSSDSEDWVSHG